MSVSLSADQLPWAAIEKPQATARASWHGSSCYPSSLDDHLYSQCGTCLASRNAWRVYPICFSFAVLPELPSPQANSICHGLIQHHASCDNDMYSQCRKNKTKTVYISRPGRPILTPRTSRTTSAAHVTVKCTADAEKNKTKTVCFGRHGIREPLDRPMAPQTANAAHVTTKCTADADKTNPTSLRQ